MKILLIAGHGQGDPGACGCGYQEATLTRELVALVQNRLSTVADVTVFDTSTNMYTYLKAGNKYIFKDYDYVLEIHFNAFGNGANGTEILVHTSEKGVSVEEKIIDNITKLGFKNRGVKPNSFLLNMRVCKQQQGVSYALLEVCFIDNISDMDKYTPNKSKVADAIVDGIISGFGLKERPSDYATMVCDKAGLADTTKNYLNNYKYAEDLWKKLWGAMQ